MQYGQALGCLWITGAASLTSSFVVLLLDKSESQADDDEFASITESELGEEDVITDDEGM